MNSFIFSGQEKVFATQNLDAIKEKIDKQNYLKRRNFCMAKTIRKQTNKKNYKQSQKTNDKLGENICNTYYIYYVYYR